MKTIQDAVRELNGVWPCSTEHQYMIRYLAKDNWRAASSSSFKALFSKKQFETEAKRMGYINGYQWGVEYPTNGEKPNLPDDVLIDAKTNLSEEWLGWTDIDVKYAAWTAEWNQYPVTHFKIIDERYKPAEQTPRIDVIGQNGNTGEHYGSVAMSEAVDVDAATTKREQFAMAAMQGLLSNSASNLVSDTLATEVAALAVRCADALLAELERTK